MLKKISVSALALAVVGFAAPTMAQPVNPWAPAQTTVPVTVTVQPMVELFTDVNPVALSIYNAGANTPQAPVTRTLYHLHNVPVEVKASIDNDIPNNTQFHVLVGVTNPVWTGDFGAGSGASKTISWRREGGVYLPAATGGYPNQVTSTGVGNAVTAFAAASNAGTPTGQPGTVMDVQYFADAQNVMPALSTNPFNVVWTIAATP